MNPNRVPPPLHSATSAAAGSYQVMHQQQQPAAVNMLPPPPSTQFTTVQQQMRCVPSLPLESPRTDPVFDIVEMITAAPGATTQSFGEVIRNAMDLSSESSQDLRKYLENSGSITLNTPTLIQQSESPTRSATPPSHSPSSS